MPDDAAPGVGHHSDGIAIGTHPVGHHRRALGSVAEVFVLPVVELHRCLRCVAAVAVQVHIQLAAERGQLLRQPLGDGVLVELVARGADDLQRTVALHAFHHTTHRGHRWRTADVARTIVAVHQAQIALADLAQQHCIARQVLVGQPLRVVIAVGHEDLTAVDALPHAEGIGIAAAALVERLVAPHQLLRRETYQPAVFGQRGHRIGEAEAVGQEHIGALLAELLAIERLAEQDVTNPRLRRADDGLVGIPAAAGDVPATLPYPVFQLCILRRIVFLHPGVFHAALEVENVVGILAEQVEVLHHRVPDIGPDGGLHIPVPLGVQMGIGNHIHRPRCLCRCGLCSLCAGLALAHQQQQRHQQEEKILYMRTLPLRATLHASHPEDRPFCRGKQTLCDFHSNYVFRLVTIFMLQR